MERKNCNIPLAAVACCNVMLCSLNELRLTVRQWVSSRDTLVGPNGGALIYCHSCLYIFFGKLTNLIVGLVVEIF
jgi:hypothetical protein